MHRTDAPGNVGGLFTEGDPYASPPVGGAVVSGAWLNDVQGNLAGAIEAAGIPLEKGNYAQLEAAVRALALDSTYRGREMRAQCRVGSSAFDLFGLAAPTALGTQSLGGTGSNDGPFLESQTTVATTVPEDIGWFWTWNEVQRRWNLDLELSVSVGQAQDSRLWVGAFSASPVALQDPASISCAAMRFDYTIDATANGGDGCWKSCTSNGSGSVIKSTGIAFQAVNRARLRFRHSPTTAGLFEHFIDGVRVATHSGTAEFVPAVSTPLGPAVLLRHLSIASNSAHKQVRCGWLALRSK